MREDKTLCAQWILFAFVGFLPPIRIDGFQTIEQCERVGARIVTYCDRIEPAPCTGSHYCIEGPAIACLGRAPPH
jgi:hypothetical protein